ncbi:MAG: putative 2OG-Fe(II) oxygenase [Pseudanabaena sp.]
MSYKATEGTMIIFPSWLNHGVEANLSDEDRLCISFNMSMTNRT